MLKNQPTVVFDLDGVIATGSKQEVYSEDAGWAYEKCIPIETTILAMRRISQRGIEIIINTARWEVDRGKTVEWLRTHNVPYHRLEMSKPKGHCYVDDRNFQTPFNDEDWAPEILADRICEQAVQNSDFEKGLVGEAYETHSIK